MSVQTGMKAGFIAVDYRGIKSVEVSGAVLDHRGWCASGSGSIFADGYCREHYENVVNKEDVEAAVELVCNAVDRAREGDNSSGGKIRVYVVRKEGVEERYVLFAFASKSK